MPIADSVLLPAGPIHRAMIHRERFELEDFGAPYEPTSAVTLSLERATLPGRARMLHRAHVRRDDLPGCFEALVDTLDEAIDFAGYVASLEV